MMWRQEHMHSGLYARVMAIAQEKGMTESILQEAMVGRGIPYDPPYMDLYADADDIRVIADILQVPSSNLFEVTAMKDELVRALFEENWPRYESRADISRREAYERVVDSEFRGDLGNSAVRGRVELVLKALVPPSEKVYECYPDCADCITRCKMTGRMIGPEG